MKSQGASRDVSKPESGRAATGRRGTVAALIAVAVLVALLWWVAQAILAHNRLQDCIDSGRRDCVPIATGTPS